MNEWVKWPEITLEIGKKAIFLKKIYKPIIYKFLKLWKVSDHDDDDDDDDALLLCSWPYKMHCLIYNQDHHWWFSPSQTSDRAGAGFESVQNLS